MSPAAVTSESSLFPVYLGAVRRATSDLPAAAQAREQALDTYRDLSDRLGQANALCRLGGVRRLPGDYPGAAQALGQVLELARSLASSWDEAHALAGGAGSFPATSRASQAAACG
jgi:Tetratricopeptide repeat